MRHFGSEFHLPIKDTQGLAWSERKYCPQGSPPVRLPFEQIARWLRKYLRGRRQVNVDALKVHVQSMTENEWVAALVEPPFPRWHRANKVFHEIDLTTVPDARADPSQAVYLRELLEIVEKNLMSDEIPYFRALLDKTPARALATMLNANPSTTSKRMKQVRTKVQSIIMALNGRKSS